MGDFGKLWGAGTISSLGDGVSGVAGPLLAAALTRDPVQVAGLTVAERLPWVLLALPSGALVDRLDRRLLLVGSSVARILVLGLLGLLVSLGHATLPLLYAVFLLAGCAGVLFENASITMVPAVVPRTGLDRANGRMLSSRTLGQTLLAPPLAGALFAVATWVPFLIDAAAFVLVTALCLTLTARPPVPAPRTGLGSSIAQGLRWLLGHRLLRTIALTVAVSNIALGAAFSILVLWAQQRLGVNSLGYGLLLTASAVGGILGGLTAARIAAFAGRTRTLRYGLIVEVLSHLGLALTRSPILAAFTLFLLGLHLIVFSTINQSLRQSLAPDDMLGRTHSAYRLISAGGLFLGAALGGPLASQFGLTAPFWLGVATVALTTIVAWRPLTQNSRNSSESMPRSAS